ncbi:MAG: rhodanese-like domain-containing protein [Syntrophus sp. (in: bacteria)]|nr:rhodanese-like domain-containing protein [Syntrophus sp. (in: bacteria)]
MKHFYCLQYKRKGYAVLVISFFLLLFLVSACTQQKAGHIKPVGKAGIQKDVDPAEAFALIKKSRNNPDFVILDVRTPDEFKEVRIDGAVNLDYYLDNFQQELDKLDKNKTYVVYCRTGRRSGDTFDIMKRLGFKEAYHVIGGIKRWIANDLPVVRK